MDDEVIVAWFQKIEAKLDTLTSQKQIKECYTTHEFASLVGKQRYTVSEWCRHGRLHAFKVHGVGRGDTEEWRISHQELERYRNEGLLPLRK